VYVANGLDGTVSRLDARSGRPAGPPLPAGPTPWRVVVGGDGSLLVLSAGAPGPDALTHVVRRGDRWAARPLPLEAGGYPLHLASAGGRYAVVAYVVRAAAAAGRSAAASPCRLALIDFRRGAVVRAAAACAPGEQVTGLAAGTDEGGPLAYLGLWSAGRAAGRIVALDAARGGVVAAYPLAGRPGGPGGPEMPGALALAPAPDGTGRRLYVLAATLDPAASPTGDLTARIAGAEAWSLLGLHPTTLMPESERPLPRATVWLTVAPDGRDAYVSDAAGAMTPDARLHRVDLASGAAATIGGPPGLGAAGLAVTADRLYIPDTAGDRLLVTDRAGRPVTSVPVGRRPLGVALDPAGSGG
jgi:DNA-binding beta-propeller fold protein YncE